MRIARRGEMKSAGVEKERAEPVGIKRILVAENEVEIIAVLGRSGGGKRGLLHHGVACDVTVRGSAEKPARLIRWSPIQARALNIAAKRDRVIFRHSNLLNLPPRTALTDH